MSSNFQPEIEENVLVVNWNESRILLCITDIPGYGPDLLYYQDKQGHAANFATSKLLIMGKLFISVAIVYALHQAQWMISPTRFEDHVETTAHVQCLAMKVVRFLGWRVEFFQDFQTTRNPERNVIQKSAYIWLGKSPASLIMP